MSLAQTIIYGDKNAVAQLLQQGADVDEIDEYGFRPLIEAAICNKRDVAQVLIEHGAAIDQEDASGRTALHWAVDNHAVDLARLLLQRRADPNHYTIGSQPILSMPLLRHQSEMKSLLYEFGADVNFALDYINTKLLGHRFSLIGEADIVDNKGRFIGLSLEGFFLEITLAIVSQSLTLYLNHFAARALRGYFPHVRLVLQALQRTSQLLKFQHYLLNVEQYQQQILPLLHSDLLILPVAYRGHAITFIRFRDLWVKCDRGANSLKEGSINIYQVSHGQRLQPKFFQYLLYQRQSPEFIEAGFKEALGLRWITGIPLAPQISGNCSWSNVEAALPAILFLLLTQATRTDRARLRQAMDEALHFYQQWQEWDKDRALYECLYSFASASRARKASKAGLLGAILFQGCQYTDEREAVRAEKILPVLTQKEYRYVLESYVKIYWRQHKTLPGKNLMNFLDSQGW